MAIMDRRIIYHFDWTVFTLALGLAVLGVVSVLSATWGARVMSSIRSSRGKFYGSGSARPS